MTLITRAYKTQLNPNRAQEEMLRKFAGSVRHVYNWGLAERKRLYEEEQKTLSHFDQCKLLTIYKQQPEVEWLNEVPVQALQASLQNLDRGYKAFFRRVKKGEKPGFPRFKSRAHGLGGFKFFGTVHVTERTVKLPKIGWMRLHEKGYIPTGSLKIMSGAVTEKAGKWYISLTVEEEREIPTPTGGVMAIHLGLRNLATVACASLPGGILVIENPQTLLQHEQKLKRLQRWLSRTKPGSRNREKARKRLNKHHARITNIRQNAIHEATTRLVRDIQPSRIIIEDWDVKEMMQDGIFSKSIADASWGEWWRQVSYKCQWYGAELVIMPRHFPSSKECSECEHFYEDFPLSQRIFVCPKCGMKKDRDHNAVANLLKYNPEGMGGGQE